MDKPVNGIIVYQNRPKTKLIFAKKIQNFWVLGAPSPDPRNSPQPLQISDLDICLQLDTKTWVIKVLHRHFFLKSQAQAIIISRKKTTQKLKNQYLIMN